MEKGNENDKERQEFRKQARRELRQVFGEGILCENSVDAACKAFFKLQQDRRDREKTETKRNRRKAERVQKIEQWQALQYLGKRRTKEDISSPYTGAFLRDL